ncbi:hypothetical protein OKJ48_04170 [Streptomyces kunmingensis]|uniref:Uncharacterized protein n=1 Tax=Streptomyces kunmingensis TaxID=68225 RepID=A0ABU6C5F6_9ACTN|nr:hypothetical protein [Streptomyces kunmingensis]MEB3959451.1 hypothetical protein [Streptomyces kunmingensis]
MAPQAVLEAGRLSAIAKILDRAGGHLSAAARDDAETSAIQSLLALSRSASYDVTCAVRHAVTGELDLAREHLEAARTAPDQLASVAAGMPRPLPAGVRTALQLLRGITGFFSSETEDAFVRALSIDAARSRAAG